MARYKVLRYLAYTLEILAFYMVQQTPGLVPEIFGVRPELLVPIALAISFFESEPASMTFGIFAGILIDFGMGGVIGFHALVLAIACYALATLSANLLRGSFFTFLIAAVLLVGGVLLLQWLFFFALYGHAYPLYALLRHSLPRFAYTLAVSPILYFFNRALALRLQPRDESF